jgi:hypothetical protein
MARNEDNDPDDDDDDEYSIFHRQQPLRCLPPHPAQLISLDQHGSSDDGGPTHMRYTSHCFI